MKFAFIFVGGLIFFWRPFFAARTIYTWFDWAFLAVIYRLLVSNSLDWEISCGFTYLHTVHYGRRIGRRN